MDFAEVLKKDLFLEIDSYCVTQLKLSTIIFLFTTYLMSHVDKAPRLSIGIIIWILSSDTETSAATPLGGGARKVLAK